MSTKCGKSKPLILTISSSSILSTSPHTHFNGFPIFKSKKTLPIIMLSWLPIPLKQINLVSSKSRSKCHMRVKVILFLSKAKPSSTEKETKYKSSKKYCTMAKSTGPDTVLAIVTSLLSHPPMEKLIS